MEHDNQNSLSMLGDNVRGLKEVSFRSCSVSVSTSDLQHCLDAAGNRHRGHPAR